MAFTQCEPVMEVVQLHIFLYTYVPLYPCVQISDFNRHLGQGREGREEAVFIHLGFNVAFNTVYVISRRVVLWAEETRTYRDVYCKLPTIGIQLPTLPHSVWGLNHRLQRLGASMLPLCHNGPLEGGCKPVKDWHHVKEVKYLQSLYATEIEN